MAVSAPLLMILAVQAVPSLLSCLAFTSFSPLFFVGSLPFSVLFVALSVLISVCSWCWSPHDGVPSGDENDANFSSGSLYFDCSRASSKLSNRAWWTCVEAPRGLQLAMLFLTWALLFLLLCMPPMANAEIGSVQSEAERLRSHVERPEVVASSEVGNREVISEEANEVESSSEISDNGGSERRHEGVSSGLLPNNGVEETSPDAPSLAPVDGKVELQSCRALVRAGRLVRCGPPASPPAREVGFSGTQDCSKDPPLDERLSLPAAPESPSFPGQLEFGMQPLHQRQVAFLTIMNSCNGSRLSLLAAQSDNKQFFVTGFSAKLVAPGGSLTFPVCYLPQHVGAAKGSLTIETGKDPLVVQLQGEGLESLYKMHVRVHGKSHYVVSLFNPFNETLFVEEVVVSPENDVDFKEGFASVGTRVVRDDTLDDIVIEAEDGSPGRDGESRSHEHGLLMRAGETWELPAQTMKDIVDFSILLEQGEKFRGAFEIRVSGAALEGKRVTLVYPFSSRVSHPSPVLSIPDTLDFGRLVGDEASSQPLILQNSGEQFLQIEEIHEVPRDPRIAIDYEKGRILQPGMETEVANITFRGQNQPRESSSAFATTHKFLVRTNSTIGHRFEVPYQAVVLQCLNSPPAMAFSTGSTRRAVGDLGGSHEGQGITDLLMDYKLFMALLTCGLVVSVLIFFQVVVHDTELPTISGDLGKGGCHRRSNNRVSPLIKKRDKLLKMWGWGALATVVDGIWAAFGSSLWNKDCSTSSPDYNLPRSATPAAQTATTSSPKSSTGGAAGASSSGTPQAGGRKGSSDRKNNGAAKADQTRSGRGNAETGTGGLPVTTKDPSHHHHASSVKQPKSSKFLRAENASTKHASFMESAVEADGVAKEDGAVATPREIEPIQTIALAPSPGPVPDSSIKESSLNTTSFSSVPVTQKPASPCEPPVERERRRRRRRKSARHDVAAANLGTMSPASPASPVTPSAAATWSVSPPSPEKKSDQSTASLSPRSSGSVDLADAAQLPKLKVKVLHSNPALVASGTDSPRRNVGTSTPSQQQQQTRSQGKAAAEHRKQSLLERGSGVGKRSNFSEWAAFSRKKTPSTGYSKDVVADGSQSYRASRHSHRGGHAYGVSEGAPGACFTSSASFPRLQSRQGWVTPPCDFGIGERVDSFDTSVVPPPAIAPALRAPGAKITKPAAPEPGWTSLGFTASPELHDGRFDRDLISGTPWQASSALSGQSSGELVYDIWGNHFGNLSHCSAATAESAAQPALEKDPDPVSGFHRLLVPEHHPHADVLFAGAGFAGDMSPTAQALYATFSGFFSDKTNLVLDDSSSRPGSPVSAHDLPDQLYPSDVPPPGSGASKLGLVAGTACPGRPRVRVPYSPPMGGAPSTAFSTSAFSPLSTPTAASASNENASSSFWAHDNGNLKAPERVASPTLALSS